MVKTVRVYVGASEGMEEERDDVSDLLARLNRCFRGRGGGKGENGVWRGKRPFRYAFCSPATARKCHPTRCPEYLGGETPPSEKVQASSEGLREKIQPMPTGLKRNSGINHPGKNRDKRVPKTAIDKPPGFWHGQAKEIGQFRTLLRPLPSLSENSSRKEVTS